MTAKTKRKRCKVCNKLFIPGKEEHILSDKDTPVCNRHSAIEVFYATVK